MDHKNSRQNHIDYRANRGIGKALVEEAFNRGAKLIRKPMPPGSRVIIGSSGAAMNSGSPLSGSYAEAKRQQWLMAIYANGVAKALGLDIHFQTIIPMQIIGETELGYKAAEA